MINSDPAQAVVDYLNRLAITLSTERKMHFFPQQGSAENPVLVIFVEQDGKDSYFEINLICPSEVDKNLFARLKVQLSGPCEREISYGLNHPVVFLKLPKGDYRLIFSLSGKRQIIRESIEVFGDDLFEKSYPFMFLSGDIYCDRAFQRCRLHLFVNSPRVSKITLFKVDGEIIEKRPWYKHAVFDNLEKGRYTIEVEVN